MPKRGRPRLVSNLPNTTKLFVDDRRELIALSSSERKSMSDAIRELVHEALRERRLRSFGRDEKDDFVRQIHRETIAEGIGPLIAEIANLRQTIETISTRLAWEERSLEILPSATDQATLALIRMILSRVMITEHITKVLVTVGMQKDNVESKQINAQLFAHDENGHRQAEAIAQKILDQFKLQDLNVIGATNGGIGL